MKNSITLVSNILVKYIGYLHLITYFFTSFNKIKLTFLTSKESQYAVIHVTFTPTLFKPLQATDPTKKLYPRSPPLTMCLRSSWYVNKPRY